MSGCSFKNVKLHYSTLQKQVGCFNHMQSSYPGCRQTGETLVACGFLISIVGICLHMFQSMKLLGQVEGIHECFLLQVYNYDMRPQTDSKWLIASLPASQDPNFHHMQ